MKHATKNAKKPDAIVREILKMQKNPEFMKQIELFIKETTR
jgi:hypothetical protein